MKSSKSSLFLMELIISILFFSLASAVCIQLFVKAHVLDKHTDEQNHAIVWSQNLAALWQANNGDLNTVNHLIVADFLTVTDTTNSDDNFPSNYLNSDDSPVGSSDNLTSPDTIEPVDELVTSENYTSLSSDQQTLTIFFNQDFEPCSQVDMTYTIILVNDLYDTDLHLLNASITLYRKQENIFSLPLSHHFAQEKGDINE